MPGRREAHAFAWMALVNGVILGVVSAVLGFWGRSFLGRPPGGDFVEFYTVGKIFNHYGAARIFDFRLADRLQHATVPAMPDTQMLMFAQTPFIAWLFRPFALLPYAWAYASWLVFSAVLYFFALGLLFHTLGLKAKDRKTGYLLALSSTPFLFETWIGGQMSVAAFAIWALFFWCLETDRRYLSGLVLALCLFKPTLVALPALMLLTGWRWRELISLLAGVVLMAQLSFATVGRAGLEAWFKTLVQDRNVAAQNSEAWHLAKNIDLLSFLHLIAPGLPSLVNVAFISVALAATAWLGWAWLRWDKRTSDRALWAATLCFTLVISPYAPIYEAVLVVMAVALVASQPAEVPAGWLVALYVVPWLTQSFAEFLHVQLITLVVLGFGIWALRLSLQRVEAVERTNVLPSKLRQEESTITGSVQPPATGRFQVRSRGLP
jgi:Glycosyltransferase family 87